MNKVLLYINEILISLDIPPLTKRVDENDRTVLKRQQKNTFKDRVK